MSVQSRWTMSIVTPVAIGSGITALAIRPSASLGALAVTVAVGAIGALATMTPPPNEQTRGHWTFASLALGIGSFLIVRWLRPQLPLGSLTSSTVLASVVAAFAEEVFFRRLVYGWLVQWGTWAAVGGAAAAFAAVHVPAYGLSVLPLDFAAGLLFGWQRWVTGRWTTPAFTHMVANLVQFLP